MIVLDLPPKPAIIRPAPLVEVRFGLSFGFNRVGYDRFRLAKNWQDASLEELRPYLPSDLRGQPDWLIRAMLPTMPFLLGDSGPVKTTVILNTASGSNQTWTVINDWNSASNIVHVIGAGGSGGGAVLTSQDAGGGAGGGAYSAQTNISLTPGGSATYRCPTGPTGTAGAAGTVGGDAWFNNAALAGSPVGAKGGAAGGFGDPGTGGSGGASGSGTGATKFSGGAGSSGSGSSSGGAGGGAAGPGGAGGAASGTTGGTGGNGSGGAGGGQGVGSSPNPGDQGFDIDSQSGSGGGGAGRTSSSGNGGSGGLYGGGGGGARTANVTSRAGGGGAQGVIVVINNP